ncbi:MAG: PTS sugar transporter subunit IIB [Brevinema sp.]
MKVLVSCISGMGSSQMIKMKISKVLKEMNIPAEVTHLSLSEAKPVARNYDVVFCSVSIVENFKVDEKTKVIGLKNLLSEQEIADKIKENNLQ